jgi:hypothetical protein
MDSGARYLPLKPVIEGHPFRDGIRQQTSEVGFPIRKSADQSLFAAPHGLSQRTTSFIACACQGIHRTPFCHFIALIINARRSVTPAGAERRERNGRHPQTRPSRQRGSGPPARLERHADSNRPSSRRVGPERPVSHENFPSAMRSSRPAFAHPPWRADVRKTLLFTMSVNRQRPAMCGSLQRIFSRQAHWRARRSSREPAQASPFGLRRAVFASLCERRLVEPDGIEPTTSCLQSTRSPN